MGRTGRLLLRGLVWGSVLVGCLPQAALAQKTVSTGTGRSPAPVRAAEEQEDAQEELYVPSGQTMVLVLTAISGICTVRDTWRGKL